jgi:cell division protein FtsW
MNTIISKRKTTVFIYDAWLMLATFILLTIGLLMVASASMVVSDQQFGTPFHFLIHQLFYVGLGVLLAAIVMHIPIIFWENMGVYLLLFSLLLLGLVLIPGVGRQINGSMRWLGFGGFGLEVSEFAKFCSIIYLAGYLKRREDEVRTHFTGFIKPMMILMVVALLLLLEPDFGATAVIMITALGMLFLSGARLWQFLLLAAVVAGALAVLAISSPYRLARLTSFLNPWARPFDTGYQLTQSLIAFGRGGLWGVGLGSSMQKLFYLPEAHTDFLFAVLAEEFGIIGEILILGLFSFLVARILRIGRMLESVKNSFAAYLSYGFALWIALQVMINVGVNMGILPTKGLTLPFISYGGSSMLFNCILIGILLRVYHEYCLKKITAFRIPQYLDTQSPQPYDPNL